MSVDKQEARIFIKYAIRTGFIVHPNTARQLYRDAQWPMPEHLKPIQNVLTEEETAKLSKAFYASSTWMNNG